MTTTSPVTGGTTRIPIATLGRQAWRWRHTTPRVRRAASPLIALGCAPSHGGTRRGYPDVTMKTYSPAPTALPLARRLLRGTAPHAELLTGATVILRGGELGTALRATDGWTVVGANDPTILRHGVGADDLVPVPDVDVAIVGDRYELTGATAAWLAVARW